MLERINSHQQVAEIHDLLQYETNWYWWTEGRYPPYNKFENWVKGCDNDPIGIFINRGNFSKKNILLGFSRFSTTSLLHGYSYLTIWTTPKLRESSLLPIGVIAACEALRFAFDNYDLRKIYFHVIKKNTTSISPLQKISECEGTLSEHYFFDGQYQDVAILSIKREKWEQAWSRYKCTIERYI